LSLACVSERARVCVCVRACLRVCGTAPFPADGLMVVPMPNSMQDLLGNSAQLADEVDAERIAHWCSYLFYDILLWCRTLYYIISM